MKNIKLLALLLTAVLLSTTLAFAGSPRMILVEEATNASCGPCASANPAFQEYINTHLHEVIPVVYHAWWPGASDPMYLKNTGMNRNRVNYYGMASYGVPAIAVNGEFLQGPGNVETGVAKWRGKTSPVSMMVDVTRDGKKMNITVAVQSDEAVAGKLRIVVCEQFHYYEAAGNNGEKDFFYLARKMFPDDGIDLMLDAGGQDQFDESYTIDDEFNADKMYVVAYIQNDETKEVIQAATDLKVVQLPLSVQTPYFKIDPSAEIRKTIEITNPTDQFINVTVAKDESGNIIPDGWDVSLSQTAITIDPNSKGTVEAIFKAPTKAGFCRANFTVTPTIPNTITMNSSVSLNALSSNTKYAVFPGSQGAYKLFDVVTGITKYSNESALIPLSNDALINFPPKSFEISIFQFDYWNRGVLALAHSLNSVLMPGITSAISEGKKILIFSEFDITYGFSNPTYASSYFNSFVGNVLGLQASNSVLQHIQVDGSGNITGLNANKLTGILGDEISSGMDYTFNTGYALPNDLYYIGIFSDILTKKTSAESEVFLHYNANTSYGAAVRVIRDDSRIIYCSFDPKAIQHDGMRSELVGRLLLWLDKKVIKVQPVMVVSVSNLDFEKVPVGTTKEMSFDIESKGSDPLEIKTLKIDWDDDLVFSITNIPPLPLTIQPDQKYTVNVKFTPKAQQLYDVPILEIESNDPDNPYKSLSLKGEGEPVTVGPKISLSAQSLEFGEIEIGYSMDKEVVITNLGGESLVVDEILFENNSDASYAFVDLPVLPFMIKAGKTQTISVRFAPKAETDYNNTTIKIESNDDNDPTMVMNLSGKGKLQGNSVDDEQNVNTPVLALSVGPNPVVNSSVITYNLNTPMSQMVTLTVVDQAGRVIAKLLEQQVLPGENRLEFNSTGYASGTYFLVARTGSFSTQIPLVIAK